MPNSLNSLKGGIQLYRGLNSFKGGDYRGYDVEEYYRAY